MAKGPDDTDAERIRLPKRLKREISKLRTGGFSQTSFAAQTELLLIATNYAPDAESDSDRIKTLLEAATTRKWGRSEFARVVRLAYGLDPETRGKRPEDRYKAAYEVYDEHSESNFTTRVLPGTDKGLGNQIADFYWDGEVAQTDPPSSPKEVRASGEPEEAPPQEKPHDSPTRTDEMARPLLRISLLRDRTGWAFVEEFGGLILLFLSVLTVIVIIIAAYLLLSSSSSGSQSPPKSGTVIDALTGKPVPHPVVKFPANDVEPHAELLRFCDLSDHAECKVPELAVYYTEAKPFVAKVGDIIEGRFDLYGVGPKPVPYLRLEVRAGRFEGQTEEEVQNFAFWPTADGMAENSPKELAQPKYGHNFQMIEVVGVKSPSVRYLPGSTELWKSQHEPFVRLPDGIMGRRGIYLTELGTPENCLCPGGGEGYRQVSFKFEVLDEKQ